MNYLLTWLVIILKHPVIKRSALAIPLGVYLGMHPEWFGYEHSTLYTIASALFSYWLIHFALLENTERIDDLKRSKRALKKNVTTIIKYSVLTFLIYYFEKDYTRATDTTIQQIQYLVETLGLFLVLMLPMFSGLIKIRVNNAALTVRSVFEKTITGLVIYLLTLWALGRFGEDTKEWIIAHQNDVVVTAISMLLLWFVFKVASVTVSFSEGTAGNGTERYLMPVLSGIPKITQRDEKLIAAHESGHALIYAALGSLPPNIELVINVNRPSAGRLGHISRIFNDKPVIDKTYSNWMMLVLMAGQYAESFAFGRESMGSAKDHKQWMEFATVYLSNHFDGVYYAEPQNKFEQEHNVEKLEKLRSSQINQLEKLFATNSGVFESLSGDLLVKKKMGRDELIPHLSQVVLPDDFPKPLGDFSEFSSDWPENSGLLVLPPSTLS